MTRERSRSSRRLIAAGAIVVAASVAVAGFLLWPSDQTPPPETPEPRSNDDPRVAYNGPYRNVHPDVKYVGDQECASCHEDKMATYQHHPMSKALAPILQSPPLPDGQPFQALGSTLQVQRTASGVVHRQSKTDSRGLPLCDFSMEIKYAVGAGVRGQSYLSEQDGYVQQSPITWFGESRIWGPSPGWVEVGGGRPAAGECLFCHTNRVEPLPGYANRFAAPVFRGHGIGCERCHGPGEKHLATAGGLGPNDPTIVNPRKLPWRTREAVCRQCHLEGEARQVKRGRGLFDFRPGLPLEDFWVVAVRTGTWEDITVINHVEQLEESRCFQRSTDENKLGCITCHDPHVKPEGLERVVHFRKACLSCHEQRSCAVPDADRLRRQPQDSCIECHMPKRPTVDVQHFAGADHRIPRRPDQPGTRRAAAASAPARLFHRGPNDRLPAEERRDLGVAIMQMVSGRKVPSYHAGQALDLLDEALQSEPADPAAWEARGGALRELGRAAEAYEAFRETLRRDADRESSLVEAGLLAMQLDRKDEAVDFWKRAVARNPWRPLHHGGLAILYSGRQQWREARDAADNWVRLEPGMVEARRIRTLSLLRLGERDAAAKEFALIEALNPPNLADLRAWWKKETESSGKPVRP